MTIQQPMECSFFSVFIVNIIQNKTSKQIFRFFLQKSFSLEKQDKIPLLIRILVQNKEETSINNLNN